MKENAITALALARVTATMYTFCTLLYMKVHAPRFTTGVCRPVDVEFREWCSRPLMISVLNAVAIVLVTSSRYVRSSNTSPRMFMK
eukprot:CAMPEP_0117642170 /NCGR_PEP_ID=MMETSP0802-20121206/9727_1 /TAXON_ID=38833 /ORGANISM="Micromonas sp., Strain CCMP2099" /LENGTH=85 /DNA_ID=CAMNT_0005447171 /DNA_START=402 /DNA_END=659 /DNA_ORIENTATION=-